MLINDMRIEMALMEGKRIKRKSESKKYLYFADGGLLMKETCDGLPRAKCAAALFVDDLTASDWEILP